MKVSPLIYIAITTLILITVAIMSSMNLPFNWVFYLTVIGQVLVLAMVYRVLTDSYTTDKTFEHFYEDRPFEPADITFENENFR
ncbi:hypothetical protein [Winogradskyella flava]|uniref:Uncharacterized protein n=1 Tax=Winogradskyella flava TaxID=1884876 RepID=A0A842IYD8_9FLAO|nr:hypothetical protein [Winogradskyella flava]MBC2846297.1 hypothetical protein [Winogradskyella flava]